jgi:hypothetical protein
MTEKHKRFDFDQFDSLIAEALSEGDVSEAQLALWGAAKVVTEADVTIEGSPDIIIYDPNQNTLWD